MRWKVGPGAPVSTAVASPWTLLLGFLQCVITAMHLGFTIRIELTTWERGKEVLILEIVVRPMIRYTKC
jgi:hypothetical protein